MREVSAEVILSVPLFAMKVPLELTKLFPTSRIPLGNVGVPARIVSVPEVVALMSEKLHAPPEPLNVRSLNGELRTCTNFPPVAEVNFTSPELCVNAPPVFRKEPPISSVPPGSVTVPVAIVKSFVVVALVLSQRHVPVAALNVVL